MPLMVTIDRQKQLLFRLSSDHPLGSWAAFDCLGLDPCEYNLFIRGEKMDREQRERKGRMEGGRERGREKEWREEGYRVGGGRRGRGGVGGGEGEELTHR